MPDILRNFAVIEGGDGAGTTTQLALLSARFAAAGGLPLFFATAEPTPGAVGLLLRRALSGEAPLLPETRARLFAADRGEHLYAADGVAARCGRGELVVSDRYTPSSLVYQGIDCGAALPRRLNAAFPLPELLIYLDVPAAVALARIAGRETREIYERAAFQERVRAGYLRLLPAWEAAGVRVAAIDGTLPAAAAGELVWSAIGKMPIMKR